MGEEGSLGGTSDVEAQAGDSERKQLIEGANYANDQTSDVFFIDYNGALIQENAFSFYLDATPYIYELPSYTLASDQILGDPEPASDAGGSGRRCFNCGSPSHVLSACPEPFDKIRVAEARSNFEDESGHSSTMRIHEVGEYQKHRLELLDRFAAGKIQSPELRDALGLDDPLATSSERFKRADELYWFHGMMKWGYPPGYYSSIDPIEKARERIADSYGPTPRILFSQSLPREAYVTSKSDSADFLLLSDLKIDFPSYHTSNVEPLGAGENRRWAPYQTTLFRWNVLPVSLVKIPLPPPGVNPVSTFTEDRKALWESIISGGQTVNSSLQKLIPPWRRPGVWPQYEMTMGVRSFTQANTIANPQERQDSDDSGSDMDTSD